MCLDNADTYIARGKASLAVLEEGGTIDDYSRAYISAIEDFTRAIEMDPRCIKAHLIRGQAYSENGEYEKAINDYDKVLELDPGHNVALTERGAVHSIRVELELSEKALESAQNGEHDEAIKYLDKIAKLPGANRDYACSELVDYYWSNGLLYTEKGDFDSAIDCFGRAVELDSYLLDPEDEGEYAEGATAYFKRGRIHYIAGQAHLKNEEHDKAITSLGKAIEDFTMALRFDNLSYNAYAERTNACFLRSRAYASAGEHDKARADFAEAQTLFRGEMFLGESEESWDDKDH